MSTESQRLHIQLMTIARLFRLGKEIEASATLKQSLDCLIDMIPNHSNKEAILALVPHMLNAQESHDWLNLADTLEHELVPLI